MSEELRVGDRVAVVRKTKSGKPIRPAKRGEVDSLREDGTVVVRFDRGALGYSKEAFDRADVYLVRRR